MSEEIEAIDDEMDEEIADERKSNGPGLRLGVIVGLIAGAIVATLFAPPTGEDEDTSLDQTANGTAEGHDASLQDQDEGTPIARVRALVEHVRARMREASREAEIATREAEALAHARYAELTHQEGKTK